MKKLYYIIIAALLIATGFIIYGSLAKADIYGSSLVGWWRFDTNDDLNGVTLDRSGNGNNGKLINIATSTFYSIGKIGQGFNFDGTNDYVNIGNPASLQITGSLTLSAWVYLNDYSQTTNRILTKFPATAGQRSYEMSLDNDNSPNYNNLSILVSSNGTTLIYAYDENPFPLTAWTLATVVYDASAQTLAIYKNGALIPSTLSGVVPASIFNGTGNVVIGQRSGIGSTYFDGKIDDARVYNRALSANEIAQLYNMGQTQFHSFSDF